MYSKIKKKFFPKKRGRPKKKSPKPTKLILGIIFILLGIALVYKFPVNSPRNILPQDKKASAVSNLNSTKGPIQISAELLQDRQIIQQPARIVIPSINIDLYTVEAKVVDGFWETSETTASHGIGSASPGERGNIVVFAHAREGLFLNLKNIHPKDIIYILTKDRWYRYAVETIKEVSPNALEVIAPTSDETLTLYTCSGFLDEKRFIVVAKPLI